VCAFAVYVKVSRTLWLDFEAPRINAAGGEDSCVVLAEKGDKRALHVYRLLQDGQHKEQWRHDFPEEITAGCSKAVTAAGDVLLQEDYSSTTLLVNWYRVLESWQQEGELIGCLPPKRAVYVSRRRNKEGASHNQVLVREEDGSVLGSEHLWRGILPLLSVCGDQDKIAVTASTSQTIFILSTQGNPYRRTPYTEADNSH